jgi:tetratricopeptide (TPR) repeat protein
MVVISAIGGIGGIGKTWLALQWAHSHLSRFPDGQLYINLRGFDPSGAPMPSRTALRSFLDALGVDPTTTPVDLDAQAALYRRLIAGKRLLIVLDNARDTSQVAPLLPGSPSCSVLVTSRNQLAGLVAMHGARPLDLDVLEEPEARDLLIRHLGRERLAAEPDAVARLLERCGGLPLALAIVAAHATVHQDFPLAALAEEVQEMSSQLDAFDTGELNVDLRTVFSWSYRSLRPGAAGLFRLLGLSPTPDIGLSAAACLARMSIRRIRVLLRDLERAYLVQQHLPGRYRMHDLLRLYAAERADHDDSEEVRYAAARRHVDFYLYTGSAGERLLYPERPAIGLGEPAAGCVPQSLKNAAAVWNWFDVEQPGLLAIHQFAAKQGWHDRVWQLAWTLTAFNWRRGNLREDLDAWRVGAAAADKLREPAIQARAHRCLGSAYARLEMYTEALDHLQRALAFAEQTDDVVDRAHIHRALSMAWARQGDDDQALSHCTKALHLLQTLDNPALEADALNAVGWFHARLGHYTEARGYCESALALHSRHQYRDGEANTLDSLGFIASHTNRHGEAIDFYLRALTLFRDLGHAYQEADTLVKLGDAYVAFGHLSGARDAWHQALDLFEKQHRKTDAEKIEAQLADLDDNSS